MSYESTTSRRNGNLLSPVSAGLPFLDWMLSMQKASLEVLSAPSPRSDYSRRHTERSSEMASQLSGNAVEVIPVGEESLNVGTRVVEGNTTRIRRVVIETPVEREVSLREEKVIVERRKPTPASATVDTLTDKVVEMTDTFEVADVWKSVRLLEEVVLRREVTNHTETVRDTVRRDEVKVEQASRTTPAPRHEAELMHLDKKVPALQQEKQLGTSQAEIHQAEAARAEIDRQDRQPAASRPNVEAAQEPKKFDAPQQDKKLAAPPAGTEQSDKKPGISQVDPQLPDKGLSARKS